MSSPIVVFDGECALCNGFVAWLIKHDTRGVFLIAGSAGDVGRAAIIAGGFDTTIANSTIVLVDGEGARVRSDAVLEILAGLGWPWRATAVARLVPRAWRDAVYARRAQRRARMAVDDVACGAPPPELIATWRARLAGPSDVAAIAAQRTAAGQKNENLPAT